MVQGPIAKADRAVVISGGCLVRQPRELASLAAEDSPEQWDRAGALRSLRDRVLAWMSEETGARTAVICADRGFEHARLLGLTPDLVVGDLDSMSAAAKSDAGGLASGLEIYPEAKESTDTEIAVDRAVSMGARSVLILAALGGRIDHELANVLLLVKLARLGIHAEIWDNASRIVLVAADEGPAEMRIQASVGDILTLLPLSDPCKGVTLKGLEYPLDKATLAMGVARGVSNVFVQQEATVTLDEGLLLAIITCQDA